MLQEIVKNEGILVIGTVKKIDDLRIRCKESGLMLRFNELLHDEFPVATWLDFFTIAKVADHPCRYHALGDPFQKVSAHNMELYPKDSEAPMAVQKEMWKSYSAFIAHKGRRAKQLVQQKLKPCTELPEKLNKNRRSHP